jgi:hypothetical protein
MNIVITTLSIGENYTKDYTNRLIQDVLNLSDLTIYVTTDCPNIINDVFGVNDRIIITNINRDDIVVRLKINEYSDDFNFNLRYLCLNPVKDLNDTVIIFTDCDNSFDWWDRYIVTDFIKSKVKDGFDFFGPRISNKWGYVRNEYLLNGLDKESIFWHKVPNYDINLDSNEWDESPLPAEYLLIFYNNQGKLNKFYNHWKYFHDYLVSREFSHGTWAEGFEIGISSFLSGFNGYDIGWNHEIWSKMIVASGYKNGHKGNVIHGTER